MTNLPLAIKYLITAILGATPIIELRYAAIISQYAFGLHVLPSFICGLIGNIIPVYFIAKKIAESEKLQNYTAIGLFLFVAVPIPTTGAWVGSLIANFLDMPPKKAVPPIILGIITAGIITVIANGGIQYLFS